MNIGVVRPTVVWISSIGSSDVHRNGRLVKIGIIGQLSYRRIQEWPDGRRHTKPDYDNKDDTDVDLKILVINFMDYNSTIFSSGEGWRKSMP